MFYILWKYDFVEECLGHRAGFQKQYMLYLLFRPTVFAVLL